MRPQHPRRNNLFQGTDRGIHPSDHHLAIYLQNYKESTKIKTTNTKLKQKLPPQGYSAHPCSAWRSAASASPRRPQLSPRSFSRRANAVSAASARSPASARLEVKAATCVQSYQIVSIIWHVSNLPIKGTNLNHLMPASTATVRRKGRLSGAYITCLYKWLSIKGVATRKSV